MITFKVISCKVCVSFASVALFSVCDLESKVAIFSVWADSDLSIGFTSGWV